jgi:hypothetical protein
VTLHGENITINAVYVNNGVTARTVNFYMDIRFANGTDFLPSVLFYPSGPQVSPGGQLPINANLGPFARASYSITFYIVDSTFARLSDSVTATFVTS